LLGGIVIGHLAFALRHQALGFELQIEYGLSTMDYGLWVKGKKVNWKPK